MVVDDVRTTGATMTAACRAIQKGLAKATKQRGGAGPNVELWAACAAVAAILVPVVVQPALLD